MNNNNVSLYEVQTAIGKGKGSGIISPENMPLMHDKLLDTIKYFDSFCSQHNLKYCLMWGSLIGAIRHKGFVPWDDDMDVAMPRADYERMFDLWEQYGDQENFSLYRTTEDFCARVPIGLLRNKNTTVIYEFNKDEDIAHGVKLDIEPWDDVPDNKLLQLIQKFHFRVFEVYATQRLPISSPDLKGFRNLKIFILRVLFALVKDKKKRFRIASKALKHATKYNGQNYNLVRCNATTDPSRKDEVFDLIKVPFENTLLNIPKGYDSILTKEYGDYMKKPEISGRRPNIEYVFYDLNSSYKKYKEIYYCKNS